MKKSVDKFKDKHSLTDAEGELKVKNILAELGKKQRAKDAKAKEKKKAVKKAGPADSGGSGSEDDVSDKETKPSTTKTNKTAKKDLDEAAGNEDSELSDAEMTDLADKMNLKEADDSSDNGQTEAFMSTALPKNKRSGQMQIKTIDMDGGSDDDSEPALPAEEAKTPAKKKDSFFVGGEESSSGGKEDEGQMDEFEDQTPTYHRKDSFINGRGRGNRGVPRLWL